MTHHKQLEWNYGNKHTTIVKVKVTERTHIDKKQYDVCGSHIGEQSLDITTYENIGAETKMTAMSGDNINCFFTENIFHGFKLIVASCTSTGSVSGLVLIRQKAIIWNRAGQITHNYTHSALMREYINS